MHSVIFSKMQFMTSIKLSHVSARECHHKGVSLNKGIQVQHANIVLIALTFIIEILIF